MERSKERDMSNRMSRHLEKRQQGESKSPKQADVNLYATKQRYKHSFFNSAASVPNLNTVKDSNQRSLGRDKSIDNSHTNEHFDNGNQLFAFDPR